MSPPTVRRIKEQIYSGKQNENIRRGGRSKEMSIEEKLKKYKDEWVNIFKQNQKLNRTQLKALNSPLIVGYRNMIRSGWKNISLLSDININIVINII